MPTQQNEKCAKCQALPQHLHIRQPWGKYSEMTEEYITENQKLQELLNKMQHLVKERVIYYENTKELYQCPTCQSYFVYANEYSEDGPGNVSSEIWTIFDSYTQTQAENLRKWDFQR